MCGDGVIFVLELIAIVFVVSEVVKLWQGSLAVLGANCCVG